jgi:hypothetical protein
MRGLHWGARLQRVLRYRRFGIPDWMPVPFFADIIKEIGGIWIHLKSGGMNVPYCLTTVESEAHTTFLINAASSLSLKPIIASR